jgi:hypothetical protein
VPSIKKLKGINKKNIYFLNVIFEYFKVTIPIINIAKILTLKALKNMQIKRGIIPKAILIFGLVFDILEL